MDKKLCHSSPSSFLSPTFKPSFIWPWQGRVGQAGGIIPSLRRLMLMQRCKPILLIMIQGVLLLRHARIHQMDESRCHCWETFGWKKGSKKSIHGDTVLPLLDLITDELLCFFEYHEQGMIVDNGMLYISTCKLSRDFKPSLQCKSNSHFMLGEITCFSLSVLTKRVSKTPSRKSWVGFEVCCICKTNTHWPK